MIGNVLENEEKSCYNCFDEEKGGITMAKVNLEELLVGKKMEPRYMEYNWRDGNYYR